MTLPPEAYLWFKTLHIIGVVVWFAGLFYLVRLFIYHVESEELEPIVSELLMKRAAARDAKDWEAADAIRSELAALGITVQDTADGPEWEIN